MAVAKTRCKQCVNSKSPVNQKPCSECNEIQYKMFQFENHFIAKRTERSDES